MDRYEWAGTGRPVGPVRSNTASIAVVNQRSTHSFIEGYGLPQKPLPLRSGFRNIPTRMGRVIAPPCRPPFLQRGTEADSSATLV